MVSQAQSFVHTSSCTLVLPGGLLVLSACLLAYRGFTEESNDLPLNGFLANILLQMLPLVALKAKVWTCSDRVSLVPLVLCKTLLMHVTLATYRLGSTFYRGMSADDRLLVTVDSAALFGALALLKWEFEFPMNPMHWIEHRDVRNLVVLASAAAVCSEAFFVFVQPSLMGSRSQGQQIHVPSLLMTAANYVDIVAFMPVVWRLYQAEEYEESMVGTHVRVEAKRQVRMFFLYVLAFYSWDDVIDPAMTLLSEPLAMMAHAAHFMLLLDFAGFFLFQVAQSNNPVKEHGEQLQGLLSREDDEA